MRERQRYCSMAACQRARKRDYQRRWRARHPSEETGRRLRQQLSEERRHEVRSRPREPLGRVAWDEVEAELGLPATTVLMHVLGVVVRWLVRRQAAAPRDDLDEGDAA